MSPKKQEEETYAAALGPSRGSWRRTRISNSGRHYVTVQLLRVRHASLPVRISPERADDVMATPCCVRGAGGQPAIALLQTCYHNFMRTSLAGNYKPSLQD